MRRPLTPLDLARRAFKLFAARPAVEQGSERFSYAEFGARTFRLVRALAARRIGRGDHVALLAFNTHEALLAYHAVPWSGATLVPLNPRLSEEEYAFFLAHCEAELLIVDAALLPKVADVRVSKWVIGEEFEARLADQSPASLSLPVDLDEDDVITVNYTSGTTSDPKGVMLTHRNVYLHALGLMYHLDLRPTSVYLHTLPMSHANGWGGVWAVTGAGATHVTTSETATEIVVRDVERHAVTHLSASPTVLRTLADPVTARRAPRPITVTLAGSPPHARFLADLMDLGYRPLHAYGLTETSPLVTFSDDTPDVRDHSVQERAETFARQGFESVTAGEVSVLDERGLPVPNDGETLGEVVVRGPTVMKGYFKNDAATRRALRGGWFHTGDIAVLHPDGRLQVRDRVSDIIVTGGERLSSVEVEGVLYLHPSVREAVVVGAPHATLGEAPIAFVSLHAGSNVEARDLVSFASSHLAAFKVPHDVRLLSDLPKNPNGKFLKHVLRAQARTVAG
ncbi:AMP-binding protein [Deinococcus yavapaiensis]|uniref:Fatty-acyl-CoA synthase n=1 Tax=Deinococcus yavapaiensis KR-236 TaxID=694435 RepID=A0A318S7D4_9DEIO|nr:AMP-binding protein [Deinococcus yavapaiensis]PYE54241.1 fatty-acyl-CoA synthase [Deinococcus yavapaiensis KR-236]